VSTLKYPIIYYPPNDGDNDEYRGDEYDILVGLTPGLTGIIQSKDQKDLHGNEAVLRLFGRSQREPPEQ